MRTNARPARLRRLFGGTTEDANMSPMMIEIYRILFEKHFSASIVPGDKENEYYLYLYSPGKKYYTAYRLMPGKIKWAKGVMPFRIIN